MNANKPKLCKETRSEETHPPPETLTLVGGPTVISFLIHLFIEHPALFNTERYLRLHFL